MSQKPDMGKAGRCCRLLVRLALGDTVTTAWTAVDAGKPGKRVAFLGEKP